MLLDYEYYTSSVVRHPSSHKVEATFEYDAYFRMEHPRLLQERLAQIMHQRPHLVVPGFENELPRIYLECLEEVMMNFQTRHQNRTAHPNQLSQTFPTDGGSDIPVTPGLMVATSSTTDSYERNSLADAIGPRDGERPFNALAGTSDGTGWDNVAQSTLDEPTQ